MNKVLNNLINEEVKLVFEQNQQNIMDALASDIPTDLQIPEACVPFVLNAVRLSMVYSIQLTMENLVELGALSLDEKALQKNLLKHLSDT